MSKSSALIIIDMQNEFCLDDNEELKENYTTIVKNINQKVLEARKEGWSIIWLCWEIEPSMKDISQEQRDIFDDFEYSNHMVKRIKLNKGKKVFEKGSWSAEVISELNQKKEDVFVGKNKICGFWGSNLNDVLRKNKITDLYFAGINTDQCVLTTLLAAHFQGYKCFLYQSCTMTSSPSYCYEAAIYNIKSCFGTILD